MSKKCKDCGILLTREELNFKVSKCSNCIVATFKKIKNSRLRILSKDMKEY